MDNAALTRLVNGKSQPRHFFLSLSFLCALNSWETSVGSAIRDRGSLLMKMCSPFTHFCLPVYKKQWFSATQTWSCALPSQREAAGKKRKRSRCFGRFCKEYGLVSAEVHFCQDALGFHGALDERDHTELSSEWQAVQEKRLDEQDMLDLKEKNGVKKESICEKSGAWTAEMSVEEVGWPFFF